MAGRRGKSAAEVRESDEQRWRAAKEAARRNMPQWDVYGRADNGLGSPGIRVENVASALRYLADVTGDPAFEEAGRVFDAYRFRAGGLEASVKATIRNSDNCIPAMLVPMIENAIGSSKRKLSVIAASREVAIEFGVPGTSLENATEKLRKAYGSRRKVSAPLPAGDTGVNLKVQLSPEFLGSLPEQARLFGGDFDQSGRGFVPDDRLWRTLLREGRVARVVCKPSLGSKEDKEFIERGPTEFSGK